MTARSDPDAAELARLLMVEITARLEDLAAQAAEWQLSAEPATGIAVQMSAVVKLMEAREAVVR